MAMTPAAHSARRADQQLEIKSRAVRIALVGGAIAVAFTAVSLQLVRLAMKGQHENLLVAAAAPVSSTYSRPDIVDRNGRLLASDVPLPSLYADPKRVPSVDETLEQLSSVLPGIATPELRRLLSDKARRFIWIKRRMSTALAERIHALGLPGLAFRNELARSYPQGRFAGHLLGHVNGQNRGVIGLERYIDEQGGVRLVPTARVNTSPPVRLTIDAAAQFAVEEELRAAMARYQTVAATGVVMDARTGEVRAAASVPGVDPDEPTELLDKARMNRLAGDVYELGSVFKVFTIAMALETGLVGPSTIVDVTQPLKVGRFTIRDFHPARRPLTVTEVFTKSSNVGAGRLALEIGQERQQAMLKALGVLTPMATEAGVIVHPKLPQPWGKAATITVAYGHGLAVAPLQFAASAAALVNGGIVVKPTLITRPDALAYAASGARVLKPSTSAAIREMMRLNVTSSGGSGRRADVPGYEVGGKTGTADWAQSGRYNGKSVINSFLAAFPIREPRYVVLVTLFDPKSTTASSRKPHRTAGLNAAPTAGQIIARVAPLLGVRPVNRGVRARFGQK
ncbi:MAG: penicillin-binding protein 2 [Hyphomicrobiaceae bacterium]|nr:penicillin-binding protein 2 [Hyphomicrobiaceae bacterium]